MTMYYRQLPYLSQGEFVRAKNSCSAALDTRLQQNDGSVEESLKFLRSA